MDKITVLYNAWLLLTLLVIVECAFVVDGIFRNYGNIKLCKLFYRMVISTAIEVFCAEIAAYFFAPTEVSLPNISIRVLGRVVQALAIGQILLYLMNPKNGESK